MKNKTKTYSFERFLSKNVFCFSRLNESWKFLSQSMFEIWRKMTLKVGGGNKTFTPEFRAQVG